MELKDTINLMTSSDYKERFKAEYWQTKIRYEKLKNLCTKIEAARLAINPEPTYSCPFELLMSQKENMRNYLHDLEMRACIENIDLSEVDDDNRDRKEDS